MDLGFMGFQDCGPSPLSLRFLGFRGGGISVFEAWEVLVSGPKPQTHDLSALHYDVLKGDGSHRGLVPSRLGSTGVYGGVFPKLGVPFKKGCRSYISGFYRDI